jgi:secondary thiamine-phosphate synthase enzyme
LSGIQSLSIHTKNKCEFVEITEDIGRAVRASRVGEGVCYVFVPHTTAGLTVNERADPSVMRDILARLAVLAPEDGPYTHGEGNAAAHIKASLVGSHAVLPVQGGELVLGTWQGVFLGEFDGPRRRRVLVKVLPDAVLVPGLGA